MDDGAARPFNYYKNKKRIKIIEEGGGVKVMNNYYLILII